MYKPWTAHQPESMNITSTSDSIDNQHKLQQTNTS